jgi:choline dehydrogenase
VQGFISAAAVSLNHPSCTVRMGSKNDPMTCVDHDLKVHGLRGLRVADLSVPPELPR